MNLNLRFSGDFTIHLYEENSFNSFVSQRERFQMPNAKSMFSQMAKKMEVVT